MQSHLKKVSFWRTGALLAATPGRRVAPCAEPTPVPPRQSVGPQRWVSRGAKTHPSGHCRVQGKRCKSFSLPQTITSFPPAPHICTDPGYFILLTAGNKLVTWAETRAGCPSPGPSILEEMLPKTAGFCRIRGGRGAAACVSQFLGRGGERAGPPSFSPAFPGLLSKVQNLPL